MHRDIIIRLIYIVATALFIFGVKLLSSPKSARRGNMLAGIGMLLAIVVTLVQLEVLSYAWIAGSVAIGALVGAVLAVRVQMTDMPEMVAAFNGFGGLASILVAASQYFILLNEGALDAAYVQNITISLSCLVGAVTFTGSGVAYGKLSGKVTGNAVRYPGQKLLNLVLLLAALGATGYLLYTGGTATWAMWGLIGVSLVLGVLVVLPIGGADMPVVISLLNSYSGIAAAMTGFVLENQILIVSGSLVGASGLILTNIMCKGMNRSLTNVLFGSWGDAPSSGGKKVRGDKSKVRSASADDAAIVLEASRKVIVVPGYGLAVAQAQHVVRELCDLLEANGCEVKYAIHPVAGRMPGHMNVLLAEADVPYPQLVDMEDINEEFAQADVALVVGANDVTNPAAREDASSPIYGMPILNCDHARTVMICKRSLSAGFAGIDNPLFYLPRTMMLFGDAKDMLSKLVGILKE